VYLAILRSRSGILDFHQFQNILAPILQQAELACVAVATEHRMLFASRDNYSRFGFAGSRFAEDERINACSENPGVSPESNIVF